MHYAEKFSKSPLTETQQNILKVNFPFYLKAGAGTGKTELLVELIIKCLNENPKASISNFVVITFTNKATSEVKRRLVERLYFDYSLNHKKLSSLSSLLADNRNIMNRQEDEKRKFVDLTSMLNVYTIHGFCEIILRQYGYLIGISPKFEIKSVTWKLNEIIRKAIDNYAENEFLNVLPSYRLHQLVRTLYEECDNKGDEITEKDIKNKFRKNQEQYFWSNFKDSFLDLFLEVGREIENFKKENNILTPNDLIKYASKLVKGNDFVATKLASKYKYLFIDEFQDTNRSQFELVNTLLEKGVNIFLVGDEKQSIYSFRGADIQSSIEMGNIIANKCNSPLIEMTDNFRSNKNVIEVINKIFSQSYSATYKGKLYQIKFDNYQPLIFPQINKSYVDQRSFPQYKWKGKTSKIENTLTIEEMDISTIIKKIKNEMCYSDNSDIKYSDIAVLCRKNRQVEKIADELKKNKIPVKIYGGGGFFQSNAIISTCKLFEYISYPSEITKHEVKNTDYYFAMLSTGRNDLEKFLNELSLYARSNIVADILNFVFENTNIEEYYISTSQHQELYNLYKLREIVRNIHNQEFLHPLSFFEYLNNMILTGQKEENADFIEDKQQDSIQVMTIHKSKGLAFNIVIIPFIDEPIVISDTEPLITYRKTEKEMMIGFNKHKLKIYNNIEDDLDFSSMVTDEIKKQFEEELRVYYVAITRARELIILKTNNRRENNIYRNTITSFLDWIKQIDNFNFYNKHFKLLEKGKL
ncbi:UvrD-helicase domain-containing protein [Caldicellulosiruptor kronotskyensis]|nr:UvrD-helicase domain-containing protein [Caldicellulosiruptor kronotskyensis]